MSSVLKWSVAKVSVAVLLGCFASGCGLSGRSFQPQPPALAPVEDPRAIYGRQPVLMPAPTPTHGALPASPNSLWQAGARSFFDDPRAKTIGDILTVEIDISDTASLQNSTNRTRTSGEEAGIEGFFGLEDTLGAVLPGGYDPETAVGLSGSSSLAGSGRVARSETINLTVAATVTQVLPNGNLVIAGRQEVRVNHEVRELLLTGVVRPEDISGANTIRHTQIAEARISYGGRGVVSDVQGPRWGQVAWGRVAPF